MKFIKILVSKPMFRDEIATQFVDLETGEKLNNQNRTALLLSSDTVFCDSNLSFAYPEILQELFLRGYKSKWNLWGDHQIELKYISGEVASIKICHNFEKQKFLRFINFERKFLQPMTDYQTSLKLVEYAKEKKRNSMSLGNDAFNEWLITEFVAHGKQMTTAGARQVFRQSYPILSDDQQSLLESVKELTSGYQYCKTGRFSNIYYYDRSSSYPSQLLNATPYGEMKHCAFNEAPDNVWKLFDFSAWRIKLKQGKIDFLNLQNETEWTGILPEDLFELFKENYESNIVPDGCYYFKTRKKFDNFVLNNVVLGKELETDPAIKKYNKAIANSIIGYFGKKTEKELTCYGKVNGEYHIFTKEEKAEPVFLPLYLYVTSKAKAEFVRTLQDIAGIENVIYANTDGFFCTKEIDTRRLNFGVEGAGEYKSKGIYKDIVIKSINGYCGERKDGKIDAVCSGLKLNHKPTPDEYLRGKISFKTHELDKHTGLIKEIDKTNEVC